MTIVLHDNWLGVCRVERELGNFSDEFGDDEMAEYVTIVLEVEDMTKFDVNFKSEIHGGKVTAMAKYNALAVADMAYEALKVCIDDGSCDDEDVLNRIDNLMLCNA